MFRIDLVRDYSQTPALVYDALVSAITDCGGIVYQTNVLARHVRFTTPGLVPGGRYAAEVIPRKTGTLVRVQGTPRSSSLRARNHQDEKIAQMLDTLRKRLEAPHDRI